MDEAGPPRIDGSRSTGRRRRRLLSAALLVGLSALGWLLTRDRGTHTPEELMQVTKPSDQEIVLTQRFAAPRATVFAAMTQPDHLMRWMKATGMTLVACDVDGRAGGSFRYVFQRPNGRKIEVRGAYQSFDPPGGFRYTETYDFSPLVVQVATTLVEAEGKTVFTQTLRYASRQERDEDFEGVATSATEAHANLKRYLTQLRPR
jgi:uncharacterized protein YndB with AHSA1/START domain